MKQNNSHKKVSLKDVFEEVKSLRTHVDKKFEQHTTFVGDVMQHSLDIKRTLDSHTEMIGKLLVQGEQHDMQFADINERLEEIEEYMVH